MSTYKQVGLVNTTLIVRISVCHYNYIIENNIFHKGKSTTILQRMKQSIELSLHWSSHLVCVTIWSYAVTTTQNMIFSVRLDLVFYHPTLLNTKFQFFDN